MNVYITAGTLDFLKKIENKYNHELMVAMLNENGALLLHETNGQTVFNEPRKYEVLESNGQLQQKGFVVMHNISVTDEGRPLFEHQFKQQAKTIVNTQGLTALRLLRPESSNPYIIMTVWEHQSFYLKWQGANSPLDQLKASFDGQQKIFTSTPYVSKYTIAGDNKS
ncbi:antibiotic biosynthesis monooxygenase [Neobacillus drentensis]|uniref:antibiotic biosynthesis monooxygenase family protein n=1 Tax=Neobacillus drentensis TaxID=220684 RepID=UPI001F2711F6|nr:antibiotic biosynthesis monooxygenase [Neobacillus drentensis]ULT58084.1 antibiotic biosynthesis monooxygenase [Neobacillus drentensis]